MVIYIATISVTLRRAINQAYYSKPGRIVGREIPGDPKFTLIHSVEAWTVEY